MLHVFTVSIAASDTDSSHDMKLFPLVSHGTLLFTPKSILRVIFKTIEGF